MSHFVRIISNKLQKIERIHWRLSRYVYIPSVFRFSVHNVGPYKPFDVDFFVFVAIATDFQEWFLSLLVVASRSVSYRVVPVKIIVSLEVTFDTVKVD